MTTLSGNPSSARKTGSQSDGAEPRPVGAGLRPTGAEPRPVGVELSRESTATNPMLVGASHAKLVHEVRKAIKRMRAFARLQRYQFGKREFDRVDSSLRAAGRRLAQTRDAEVRLATLERLTERYPHALSGEGIERLSWQLQRERDEGSEPVLASTVLDEIRQMRRELAFWQLTPHDFDASEQGLRSIYREGRQRHRQLERRKESDVEALHDWRKRVKSLYYTLDMLGGEATKGTRASTRRAKLLGDLLGEEHDLWLLSAYVSEHRHLFEGNDDAPSALVALVEQQRRRLRKRAVSLGAQLYKRKPAAFAKRMRRAFARP